jgi:hypothetical protein
MVTGLAGNTDIRLQPVETGLPPIGPEESPREGDAGMQAGSGDDRLPDYNGL